MKIIFKGRYKNKEQLPVGNLPENAVKFREPDNFIKLNLVASMFIIPVIVIIAVASYIKTQLGGTVGSFLGGNGFILALLTIIPHELLHAIAFPKESEVEVWYNPKALMAFVVSTYPTSKGRFIFLSLLPNIIFGLIPLILWVIIPIENENISQTLFSYANLNLLMGVGDYLNVFNAITQMPKGGITQLSGMNSYWYMPNENSKA